MVAKLCFPSFAVGAVRTSPLGEGEADGNAGEQISPRAAGKAELEGFRSTRRVTLTHCTTGPNHGQDISSDQIMVAIHDGSAFQMEWRPPGSDRIRSDIVSRGRVSVADADTPVWTRWNASPSIVRFAIDKSFATHIWQNGFEGVNAHAIETSIGREDPVIEQIAALGRSELGRRSAGGGLYLEALGTALTVHLLRNYGSGKRFGRQHKGGLPPAQLRRVVDYIKWHLTDGLGLIELAAVAGVSPQHFGEAFKAATGTSPHRYVIARRVERARELLRDRERPISQVAYEVGFCSQSHLTFNFRRLTGSTPGRFRRSLE